MKIITVIIMEKAANPWLLTLAEVTQGTGLWVDQMPHNA